jgi:SOS response associated peptidase (SRAP)
MCGRYLITSAPEAIRALFRYAEEPDFPPRYNIAPTQPVPIVRLDKGGRSFALMRWGLIPAWVKDPHTFSLLINARGETIGEKPAFRNAMRRRRCLFPADGFYEWRAEVGRKRVFCIRPRSGARCRNRGRPDLPGAGKPVRGLRDLDRGQPHRQRLPCPHSPVGLAAGTPRRHARHSFRPAPTPRSMPLQFLLRDGI